MTGRGREDDGLVNAGFFTQAVTRRSPGSEPLSLVHCPAPGPACRGIPCLGQSRTRGCQARARCGDTLRMPLGVQPPPFPRLHLAVTNRTGWFVSADDDAEIGRGEFDRAHRCREDAVVEQTAP